MKVLFLTLLCALGPTIPSHRAAPAATQQALFEDNAGRFALRLPEGWVFSPQPGDTGGVYFRKVMEGLPANATVRFMQFTVPIDLSSFAARIAAASDQEPGFRLLLSEPTLTAGVPALRRRFVTYINGNKRLSKVVEQRILVVGGFKGYVVHAETLADIFGSFEKDFATLFAGFELRDGSKPLVQERTRKVRRFDPKRLVGQWEGGGHTLEMSPAGTAVLDEQGGVYRLNQGVLVLQLDGAEHVFTFHLENDVLQLSGGIFGPGQTFSRRAAKARPKAR